MSRAPTPRHQIIANDLGALFFIGLKKCKHSKAAQFIDLKIAEDTIVQPDVSVLFQKATKNFIDFAPALVVEILSPSSALKDRHTKSGLYGQHGIKYYLIVSPKTEETEVYVLENGEYKLEKKAISFQYDFSLDDGCEMTIDFGELWP